MAFSVTVPVPPGAGNPVVVPYGRKNSMSFDSIADALAWADQVIGDEKALALAIAIRRAAAHAASRGKTLTFDLTAAQPVVES